MNKFKIAFCVRDQEYSNTIENVIKIMDLDNEKFEFYLISENPVKTIYRNISISQEILKIDLNQKITLDEKIWKNKEIYKADPSFVMKKKSINANDQKNFILASRSIINNNNFDLMFSGAAAHMIWTIPHLVSVENNKLAYKLLYSDYLNPRNESYRLWFCADLYWDINYKSEFDFNWDKQSLNHHINNLKESMLKENYNLASRAMAQSQNYTPTKFLNILKNIIKFLIQRDYISWLRLNSYINSLRNRKFYTSISDIKDNFILYPLNQPYDEQLLVRGSNFVDTYKNIDLILKNLPINFKLVVKEHPVNPGMLSYKKIKQLKKNYNNLVFIDPNFPIREIIKKSKGLITINSTSGIEALFCGKKIIVLGESYYRYNNMVFTPNSEEELKMNILELTKDYNFDFNETNLMIENLLNQSYPIPNSNILKEETKIFDFISEALKYKILQIKR